MMMNVTGMMEMMVSMMMMGLVGMMVMMMEVPAPTTMYSQAEVEGKLPSLCFNLTR